MVTAVPSLWVYLLSEKPFDLITDHQVPRYAFWKRDTRRRLARWVYFMAEYNLSIIYRPGTANRAADFIFRETDMETATEMCAD